MASGGARTGVPGTAYPNRTDMNAGATQPVRAASGQQYGQRGQQEAAQQAIPLPDFSAATARPNEPISHGMPTGPGPGPVAAGIPAAPATDSSVVDQIRAIYQVYPNHDLLDLLSVLQQQER